MAAWGTHIDLNLLRIRNHQLLFDQLKRLSRSIICLVVIRQDRSGSDKDSDVAFVLQVAVEQLFLISWIDNLKAIGYCCFLFREIRNLFLLLGLANL